jgi:hypothetical protein
MLDQLFEASILHDCGVSQTNVHAKLTQLQWEEESNHCFVGAELLKKPPYLNHLSNIISWALVRRIHFGSKDRTQALRPTA